MSPVKCFYCIRHFVALPDRRWMSLWYFVGWYILEYRRRTLPFAVMYVGMLSKHRFKVIRMVIGNDAGCEEKIGKIGIPVRVIIIGNVRV